MKQLIQIFAGLGLILTSMMAFAEDGDATGVLDAQNFSGNITLTSNYIFRGETQTDDGPAIQGGFDWEYESFYVGVWASNVDFDSGDSVEIDYYGGLVGEVGSFDYDLNIYYYTYPGADDDGFEFDYLEFLPTIGYTFDAPLEPYVYFIFGYSPDYFGEEGTGIDIEAGLSLTVGDFGIDGAVGNQWVDGDNTGDDIEWFYYNIGVTTSAMGFDADLRFHGVKENGVAWLANDDFPRDEFVTFSISRSF